MSHIDDSETVEVHRMPEPLQRLTRDLLLAARTMSDEEARYLVDTYYLHQDGRKRANNQLRAMAGEPHSVLAWVAGHSELIETQIRRALDSYSDGHIIGPWLKSHVGIGPVIAAGLAAHIDIHKAPSASHIWRFAGLDPSTKWERKTKRPWNAELKVICWHIGQSMMKFSGKPNCWYGHIYRQRKELETRRNESGGNAEAAARILTEKNWDHGTDAYKALTSGKLPLAQVDARARRYVVKLLLSHLHLVWTWIVFERLPPQPYAIEHMGHADFIFPPNLDLVPGLSAALRAAGWR